MRNLTNIKPMNNKLKEEAREELGRISALFMSQGDTKAKNIIMPTEELLKSAELIDSIIDKAVAAERERILKRLPKRWDKNSLNGWVTMVLAANAFGSTSIPSPQVYADGKIDGRNEVLNEIISLINGKQ